MRLRLIYANTARDYDIPPRQIDDPVVVGRSSEADLQIPSINISKSHAVMFVHNGVWMVQDSGSRDGTVLNGEPCGEAQRLDLGNKITLGTGAGAATIEVLSLEDSAPMTAAAGADAIAEPPFDALDGVVFPAPVAATRRYGKTQNTNLPVVFAITGAVLIGVGVIGGIWAYVVYTNKLAANDDIARQNANAKTEVIVKKAEGSGKKTIFMEGSSAAAPAGENPPTIKPVSPTPPVAAGLPGTPSDTPAIKPPLPASPQDDVVLDPAKPVEPGGEAWAQILEHRDSSPTPVALFHYMQFRNANPDSPKLKELDKLQAAAIDALWWQRVNGLIDQQSQIATQIADLKKEKSELPANATADRKAQFDRQVKDLESSSAVNLLLLDGEMGYHEKKPVDLGNEKELEILRKARDPAIYERWNQRVMSQVRQSRGARAW